MGSDISLLTFMQQQGVTFKDNGVAQQADQILYDNGDNLFRLRLFVNPNTNYSATEGAIQTTAYDIALAQQIKQNDPSAKFELDLHYSDTWADPGDQTLPAAWATPAETLSQLQTTVYNYTYNTLASFNAAGVMPDIVQLGNETNSGMLWPTGKITFSGSTATQEASWAAYGSLVNQGIEAVRNAQTALIPTAPKIQISLVIGNGNSSGEPAYFYQTLTNPSYGNVPATGTDTFDIMGADYYPTTHDISTLSSNLTTLANDFPSKKIMVMETDAPWVSNSSDKNLGHDPNYAETPAGQAAYFSALATTVQNLPNHQGMGLLYWYPEAVQTGGYNIYNGGDTALFDTNGNALQTIVGTAAAGTSPNGDFSITQNQWNVTNSGTWETGANWANSTGSSPTGADVEADFLTLAPGGVTAGNQTVSTSTAITLGTMRFQSPSTYTIAGTGSLSIQSSLGWGYIVVQEGAQQINVPTTIVSDTMFSVSSGSSLTFGAPVTVNSGQVLTPSGSGTINYQSSINVSSAASMTIANSTHATALNVSAGATVAIGGAGTAFEADSLSNNGTITVNSSGSSTSTLIANGAMTGTGTLSVSNGGLVTFSSNVGAGNLNSLSITGNGTLDLNNNHLFINYGSGPDPISSIATWIANGSDGNWNGTGITSTAARNSSGYYGIGYADAADPGNPAGLSSGQIEIKYTLLGDANLDGTVNGTDFTIMATNFNQAVTNGWDRGDFNYDGSVNGSDFIELAMNFNQSAVQSAVTAADLAALDSFATANGISLTSVPEPASAGMLVMAGLGMLRRRRR
jgi:arabinogalactan endo-1,4-beta-galactosidase